MKAKILKFLRERDDFVSGQELCRELSVSRTAVWKAVGQLREEGYRIQAAQNRGYRLLEAPDVVTEAEIASRLRTRWAGRPVISLRETDSTNNEAKRRAEAGACHGTLITAERQSAGRGRRGRSWDSPGGSGIWMSLILKPSFSPARASMLTLAAALAVSEGIRRAAGLETGIKWPNDLVAGGRKLCGILTEMSAEPDYINHVVVGIGINANIRSFPEELAGRATSLLLELGSPVERAAVIAGVLEAFEGFYEEFLKTEDLSLLKDRYERSLVNMGRGVCVLDPKGEWTGTARGIDIYGRLLVEPDGAQELRAVESGEVSVRGVYGYV